MAKANKKKSQTLGLTRRVVTLYRTSYTTYKNGFFHCHGTNLRSFFTVTREMYLARSRSFMRARALMFFFSFCRG
jgi:hypothetical protein